MLYDSNLTATEKSESETAWNNNNCTVDMVCKHFDKWIKKLVENQSFEDFYDKGDEIKAECLDTNVTDTNEVR